MRRSLRVSLTIAMVLASVQTFAQGTSGTLAGNVVDGQGLALPEVSLTVENLATGLKRTASSDAGGAYSVAGLPIGTYQVQADFSGFSPQTATAGVNVGATTVVDFTMTVTAQTEALTVTGQASLIDAKETGISEIVTEVQIENLPINGRQFGNLAALVPGVSLGLLASSFKTAIFSPEVGGGVGRNVNYRVDGADTNDDRLGGLLHLFPLEAIDEFNFQNQRYRAEFGRGMAGVLNVVTKSGTNTLAGSAFTFVRDKGLNALTETQRISKAAKPDYRRYQYGGSLGGPIRKDKAHFFLAYEGVREDTNVTVLTALPEKNGVADTFYRENILLAKLTSQLGPRHYVGLRYNYDDNETPFSARATNPIERWGDNTNTFHSANLNLSSVLGSGSLNDLVVQHTQYENRVTDRTTLPIEIVRVQTAPSFFTSVFVGRCGCERTFELTRLQVRDDFSWTTGRHGFKLGGSFMNEPKLDETVAAALPRYTRGTQASRPVTTISISGILPDKNKTSVPNRQYSAYVQDTWTVSNRLLLELGVRYELVTGLALDQSANPVFKELQEAARAGRLANVKGLEDFGQEPQDDKDNVAPRLGFAYTAREAGDLVLRGGVGRYYDQFLSGHTGVFEAQRQSSQTYSHFNSQGIRNPDGSPYKPGDPLPPNQLATPRFFSFGQAASPLLKQPYTDQANLGLSKTLGKDYALEIDAIYAKGRDLPVIMNPNTLASQTTFTSRFVGILPTQGNSFFGAYLSGGRALYRGVTVALKKRWDGKLQFLAGYTLSKTTGINRASTDGSLFYTPRDLDDPFGPQEESPTNTDARHRVTISGVWSPGLGITMAPIYRYRSKTPYSIIYGIDVNRDGDFSNDWPPAVSSYNSARGADFSQLDLRFSWGLKLRGRARLELIADVFNVFDDTNPWSYDGRIVSGGVLNPSLGRPRSYAGDSFFGADIGEEQSEQRQGRIGLRVTF